MKKILIILAFAFCIMPASAIVLQGGVIHENGRTITPFYFHGTQTGYGIQYDDDLYHNFYYDLNGKLTQYDVLDKPRTQFPHNTTSYDANKNIISKSKSISKTEQFVYNADGSLKAHWIGNDCFDAQGNQLSSHRELPE
ncbi:MAG: hypothetical protein LKG27_04510 [Clostridiaceae bacterium]|jgi:hypothetical protein|nr:hypothetical protein [Clostridiaceae bacterium]